MFSRNTLLIVAATLGFAGCVQYSSVSERRALFRPLTTTVSSLVVLQQDLSLAFTLSPNNRFVRVVNAIPITPGIPYHSIIGDRGRGDTPNSSDGVVPYWSSHLDGAQSELIVPSYHPAHQNPKAIAEVQRILRLHAGVSDKG